MISLICGVHGFSLLGPAPAQKSQRQRIVFSRPDGQLWFQENEIEEGEELESESDRIRFMATFVGSRMGRVALSNLQRLQEEAVKDATSIDLSVDVGDKESNDSAPMVQDSEAEEGILEISAAVIESDDTLMDDDEVSSTTGMPAQPDDIRAKDEDEKDDDEISEDNLEANIEQLKESVVASELGSEDEPESDEDKDEKAKALEASPDESELVAAAVDSSADTTNEENDASPVEVSLNVGVTYPLIPSTISVEFGRDLEIEQKSVKPLTSTFSATILEKIGLGSS